MTSHRILHMASFSRSGETLMQRCLNGHPDIEVVHQIDEPDRPEDVQLYKFLSTYAPTHIPADHPLLAHRNLNPNSVLLLKNAVWTHQHPRNGFILIRNPFSIIASAHRDMPEKPQADRQRTQQLRWARGIDPLMVPAMSKYPTIAGFLALYNRKMLHDHAGGLPFVRYEDFILDPEVYLRKLVSHFGLDWHDGAMSSHKNYKEGQTGHGGIKLWQPVHSKSETKYKTLSNEAKSLTYSIANGTLQAYGYEWDGETLGTRANADGML